MTSERVEKGVLPCGHEPVTIVQHHESHLLLRCVECKALFVMTKGEPDLIPVESGFTLSELVGEECK